MNKLQMLSIKAYVKAMNFAAREEGEVNIVATVLLIGVAVLLAIIFKGQVKNLLNMLFEQINNSATNAITN
ncbi:Flp1 family type IVb pilin [uncultured Ruminococcus sp.]|uniref:Flp1 family type IVb pilin n=1 Tax=uncultured Ruminococcus sp. TaxID=165186 RepID=UPI0025DDDB75|nr:Flp1 family type IVb pilin [uncultured Ruminococcus sp.]